MLDPERISAIKKAADTPTDNVTAETIRGMLGEVLDAYAQAEEREVSHLDRIIRKEGALGNPDSLESARRTRRMAELQVRNLHSGRCR